MKILAATTSAGAAISTSLLSIYGWRETYVQSGYTYHALESEMNRYLTQASDDYANYDKEKGLFGTCYTNEICVMLKALPGKVFKIYEMSLA